MISRSHERVLLGRYVRRIEVYLLRFSGRLGNFIPSLSGEFCGNRQKRKILQVFFSFPDNGPETRIIYRQALASHSFFSCCPLFLTPGLEQVNRLFWFFHH